MERCERLCKTLELKLALAINRSARDAETGVACVQAVDVPVIQVDHAKPPYAQDRRSGFDQSGLISCADRAFQGHTKPRRPERCRPYKQLRKCKRPFVSPVIKGFRPVG